MSDRTSDQDQLGALAEEYLARHRQGLKPSVESYAAAHPELADEIRRLFPALLMMEELKPASGDATGSFDGTAVVIRGARLERLGDFRILREVGRGGMGVVYEAEQESLGRRVALKVLAGHHLPDPAHLRRFEREARAAARLHHTNIVPVFGVGEQDGLHYYVMQFIQGLGLDDVISELIGLRSGSAENGQAKPPSPDACTATDMARSLMTDHFVQAPQTDNDPSEPDPAPQNDPGKAAAGSPSQVALASSGLSAVSDPDARYFHSVARIGLQVARALEYAHSQGIFHRDVKPSNLLLDVQGTAWVADFGLAKAAEGDNLTHTGDIVGTIRYMAPERFRGKCDARSDVYALGLTLYEMLALRPAFERTDRQELMRQVMEQEPPRLRKLNPAVPRDLETVIHKAIDKDPARRYPTAGVLAEDLAHYLDGKPVRARDVSTLERCWKWSKRRPAVALLLAGLIVAVLSGLAAVTWQWRSAVGARNDALAARDEARRTFRMANQAVDTYFTQVSEEHLLEEPGMQPLREKLLKLSLPYYRAFAEQKGHDPTLRVQLANAYLRWGMIAGEIGSREESKQLLRTAVVHFERLLEAGPTNLDVRIGMARSYQALAYQEIFTDQPQDGFRMARRAAEIWAQILQDRPDDPEPAQSLGRSLDLAGLGRGYAGDLAGAKPELQSAIVVLTDTAERFPDHSEARRKLARALNNLGTVLRTAGDLAGAEQTHSRARGLLSALRADRPSSTVLRKDLAATLRLLGQVRLLLGSLRPAEADLNQARGLIEEVVRDNPKVIEYRYLQGEIDSYLGQVWAEQGQTARSRASLYQDIALERELLRSNPNLSENLLNLADSASFLAGVERETGRFDLAAPLNDEALAIMEKQTRQGAGNPAGHGIHFHTVIESARLVVRPGEALSSHRGGILRALLQRWEQKAPVDPLVGADRHLAVEGYLALAELAARSGSPTEVLEVLNKADATLAVALGATPNQLRLRSLRARIETARGFALAGAGQVAQATRAANRAVDVAEPLAREDPSYNYDLACAHALQARLDPSAPGPQAAAVKALETAIKDGFDNAYKLQNDDRLAPLRSREDFRAVVRLAEERRATAVGTSEARRP
jgi:serine/threonine-protein kinase